MTLDQGGSRRGDGPEGEGDPLRLGGGRARGGVAYLGGRAGVPAGRLTLRCAPAGSPAGTVQVVARSLETALHKLDELKFDLAQVLSGYGTAPLPPVAGDEIGAIGRTNDAIL